MGHHVLAFAAFLVVCAQFTTAVPKSRFTRDIDERKVEEVSISPERGMLAARVQRVCASHQLHVHLGLLAAMGGPRGR